MYIKQRYLVVLALLMFGVGAFTLAYVWLRLFYLTATRR